MSQESKEVRAQLDHQVALAALKHIRETRSIKHIAKATAICSQSSVPVIPIHSTLESPDVCVYDPCVQARNVYQNALKLSDAPSCPFVYDQLEYQSTYRYRSSPWFMMMDMPINRLSTSTQTGLVWSIAEHDSDRHKMVLQRKEYKQNDDGMGQEITIFYTPNGQWTRYISSDDQKWKLVWNFSSHQIEESTCGSISEHKYLSLRWNDTGELISVATSSESIAIDRIQRQVAANEMICSLPHDSQDFNRSCCTRTDYVPRGYTYPLLSYMPRGVYTTSLLDPLRTRDITRK